MDIREIIAALNEDDVKLWQQHRTEMRRSYMTAFNAVLGIQKWDCNDDAFMDLIDIKLALVFDRTGRLTATKEIIGENQGQKIEKKILKDGEGLDKLKKVKAPALNGAEKQQVENAE
jgi:hypothetical protein